MFDKETICYRYVHGSADSTDLDVCYVFDKMPDFNTCRKFCTMDKNENRNIICIKDGRVTACFKGIPDEVNNALYKTYHFHEQQDPLLIDHEIERIICIKSVRAVRSILSMFTRSEWRKEMKAALNGGWTERIEMLDKLSKAEESIFDVLTVDSYKTIAFQLGQTIGLFEKTELYTKQDISKRYPMLDDFLYRRPGKVQTIQKYMLILVDFLKSVSCTENGTKCEFTGEGIVIDLKTEKYFYTGEE